ncbi:MAG TPA: type I methionyl aminopeptidase [Bacillota bacterium]|nr:type I methionyl aminopeptidase [Bacillota bacterium]HPF42013.1 type I methionyl aminopeptidase [Bacillota bacterium]HPJ85913.1 type I methionyl aminopeptidase [Bacillota bacterium]HPQ61807.1 type I methionyl aminopeptidase [Bacillota bacterium]HRX91216.1 type I methionyl aminopeptidase [Candidatus Izemoplasmatales bacterium]
MITIKSEREVELMREAGKIVALAHKAAKEAIAPGVSTKKIDEIIEKVIRDHDATPSFKNYNGFPAASCISVNEHVVHGIPSREMILKDGDIVSVDIGACYKGYHGDSAWTYPCGHVSERVMNLLEGTEKSLFAGLSQAKAGNRLTDISNAVQKTAEGLGYSVVREFVGHGVGQKLHEDPAIPNFGHPGRGPLLRQGMTLAIEPMINLGRKEVRILPDGWTTITADGKPSAHFEHTVLIKEDGYEILTKVN